MESLVKDFHCTHNVPLQLFTVRMTVAAHASLHFVS
jgi:hypothetical protein